MQMRIEKDSLGEFSVPIAAWYGIQTARAVANFPISGRRPDTDFIIAHARIKVAAARVHCRAGLLAAPLATAIIDAGLAIANGDYHEEFVVDRFQAGAGTSHNMNTNEVIANLANVALGGVRGHYQPIHPNDHVNMGQSTNDTIPTAIRLAVLAKLPRLVGAIHDMAAAFRVIADREQTTVKSGRTHLQDAVPTTIGREFGAYAWTLARCARRLQDTMTDLAELGLGGSAVGTGLNTCPHYAKQAAEELVMLTGIAVCPAADLTAQMQSQADLERTSAAIRGLALELIRIANDLRLLASGPRTGLAEIVLPAVQPGSSIMPGKVNPVMLEMLNQVCYQVLGQDAAIAAMTQAGQLELNVMMPALGSALFDMMDYLTHAVTATTARTIRGITIDRDRCRRYAETSVGLATLLNQAIGYSAAARLAQESERSGRPIAALVVEQGLMDAAGFAKLIDQAALRSGDLT
ncbi:MAG: aspartate ammonia-lyase [Acidiferrobacter sp.]